MKNKHIKFPFKAIAVFCDALILLLIILCLIVFLPNKQARQKYAVWGVDVSEYQGQINWQELETQGVSFAFIKATEGSSYTDPFFAANFNNIQNTNIAFGAYHFFSFESAGQTQAQNFIAAVPQTDGMLAPVIDIELYGKFKKDLPKESDVLNELAALAGMLEEYYGIKPIIYTTSSTYKKYIINFFENKGEYPLWIRDIYSAPKYTSTKNWQFWQYSDKGRLNGYIGSEKYIDLNVFYSSLEELENLKINK